MHLFHLALYVFVHMASSELAFLCVYIYEYTYIYVCYELSPRLISNHPPHWITPSMAFWTITEAPRLFKNHFCVSVTKSNTWLRPTAAKPLQFKQTEPILFVASALPTQRSCICGCTLYFCTHGLESVGLLMHIYIYIYTYIFMYVMSSTPGLFRALLMQPPDHSLHTLYQFTVNVLHLVPKCCDAQQYSTW